MSGIPPILHQTWRSTALPADFARWRDGWVKRHPRWEHRLHDDAACQELVDEVGGPWPELYRRLERPVQRADVFRYLVVWVHGGVYADLDMESYRPIDPLLEGAGCVLSVEAHLTEAFRRELGYRERRQLANCIFAAEPRHPFLGALLDHLAARGTFGAPDDAAVEDTTGPRMLTRFFESLPAAARATVRVLPQVFLMAPRVPRLPLVGPPAFARHHCAGTWRSASRQPSLKRLWIERNLRPPLWPRVPSP